MCVYNKMRIPAAWNNGRKMKEYIYKAHTEKFTSFNRAKPPPLSRSTTDNIWFLDFDISLIIHPVNSPRPPTPREIILYYPFHLYSTHTFIHPYVHSSTLISFFFLLSFLCLGYLLRSDRSFFFYCAMHIQHHRFTYLIFFSLFY